MAKIDIIKLDQELKEQKIRPIYLILGLETHLALSSLKLIETAVLGDKKNDLSKTALDGKSLSIPSLLDILNSISLMGGTNFVIVKNADKIAKEKLDNLIPILDKTSLDSVLVLVASKFDGRSKFMQTVTKSKNIGIIECKPLYSNQLSSWINMEVKRKGKQMAHDAAGYLADIVGSDLGQLMQSIEQIVLYVGNKKLIELVDVEKTISETTQRTIFELTDAIGAKNKKKSLSILKNLLDHGTQPVIIVSMIARHFRILTRAKEVEGKGAPREIASYLGVNPYFVQNYMTQAKNYSLTELKNKFALLSYTDRLIKSSRIPRERILERIILDI